MAYDFEEVSRRTRRRTRRRRSTRCGGSAQRREATQKAPPMMIGADDGAFLRFVVSLMKPKRVLEIGTFTGWSSIAIARGLPPGGTLITCDVNEETTAIARRYAEEAASPTASSTASATRRRSVATLDGPFDLVFIDADKPGLHRLLRGRAAEARRRRRDPRRQHARRRSTANEGDRGVQRARDRRRPRRVRAGPDPRRRHLHPEAMMPAWDGAAAAVPHRDRAARASAATSRATPRC